MASPSSVLCDYHLQCSICLDVFTDPVSTPCGHNFCMICLKEYWGSSSHCQCPACKEKFPKYFELCVNTFISGLAAPFRNSVQVKSNSGANQLSFKPKKVPCDSCTEEKLEAVKSCLHCGVSLCNTHLIPHKSTAKLMKHKLMEPVENLEDYICQKHERPLQLFCRDDQRFVCQFCIEGDHRTHNTVPIEEEIKEKTCLKKKQAEVQQMIQERIEKIQEIKDSVELSKKVDIVEIFSALMRCIERRQAEQLEVMEEKQKAADRQAEEFIKDLEQEITELKRRNTEMEKISNTEDHLHLLQIYPSLCSPPHIQDWTDVTINSHLSVETVRRALSQIQETLSEEIGKVDATELKRISQYTANVTLNPDTAHPELILSPDKKQVRHERYTEQNLPDNPKRFDSSFYVLGNEGVFSGKFYYEVQVEGKTDWILGLVRESSNRKGLINPCPENGYWCVWRRRDDKYSAWDSTRVFLSMKLTPKKVGVFVDFEEGRISFYDVISKSHIYSFTGQSFNDNLYPIFSPCNDTSGHNTMPLVLCAGPQIKQ